MQIHGQAVDKPRSVQGQGLGGQADSRTSSGLRLIGVLLNFGHRFCGSLTIVFPGRWRLDRFDNYN